MGVFEDQRQDYCRWDRKVQTGLLSFFHMTQIFQSGRVLRLQRICLLSTLIKMELHVLPGENNLHVSHWVKMSLFGVALYHIWKLSIHIIYSLNMCRPQAKYYHPLYLDQFRK